MHCWNAILNDLPTDIRNTIQRHTADRVDVNNIVARCLDFTNGIKNLTDILRTFEGNNKSAKGGFAVEQLACILIKRI